MQHHHFARRLCAFWFLGAVPGLYADVTLHYKTQFKLNPALAAVQQGAKGFENAMPPDMLTQFKNGKGYSSGNGFTSVCDFTTQKITLIDNAGKRYATWSFNNFGDALADAMPQMPEQAKAMLASMKQHVESKATGNSATIQGVEAEDREIDMSVEGPAMPNMPPGPIFSIVMHVWTAKKSEVLKNPAVRELAGYQLFSIQTMNPMGSLQKLFQQLPGFGDSFTGFYKEIQSGGTPVILRSQMQMYMPMLATLMKQMPAGQNPFGAGFDPSGPLMEVTQEASEISTAAVPDSVFQIPEGYNHVPETELLKALVEKSQAAAKSGNDKVSQ